MVRVKQAKMKRNEMHPSWPPKWGASKKAERRSTPYPANFASKGRLESVNEILPASQDSQLRVTINVSHPDYEGLIAGDVCVADEGTQHRIHELLLSKLAQHPTIDEIGDLQFD
jgi:hypothetical protein